MIEAKGLGQVRRQALEKAGIFTPEDLLAYYPARYMDLTTVKKVADCRPGDECLVEVSVSGQPAQIRKNGKFITSAVLRDETGYIRAYWFNQPWIFKMLREADAFKLFGIPEGEPGKLRLTSPVLVREQGIIPVYKKIDSVPDKLLKQLIQDTLDSYTINETLPESLLERFQLCSRAEAIREMHLPRGLRSLEAAQYRLNFEDLLLFQTAAGLMRRSSVKGVTIEANADTRAEYEKSLSFPLTGAQKRTLDEVYADMAADKAMARLVQGDVGCGKTAVAFGAIYACCRAGWQCAMMAPTEILAAQHCESALKTLEPLGIRCALLTGSMTKKQHDAVKTRLITGEIDCVFGTHALITPDVEYRNLGLVITDEQHRFGVRQRTMLGEKGINPNVLVMSATPIPRTLSLILYGDLDISVIDELPPGRQPVKTRIVGDGKREAMYGFILNEINSGRQAYFVCPLVEESELIDAMSAEKLYESLNDTCLGSVSIALVHGKLKASEKDALLESFRLGETKILVSTTVIEVGINVPNASVMVIENAERFGLAQLHQLRGRVGRGSDEAWCFLMAHSTEKLKILTQSNDGFVIAEKDMELRGPGDIFGLRQSGDIAVGRGANTLLLQKTHELAREILREDAPDNISVRKTALESLKKRGDVVFSAN